MNDIIIVGAGASGLYLASLLNDLDNLKVTLIEKNDKVGKKLLITGNGKCNLSNTNITKESYNNEFGYDIINIYDQQQTFQHFENLGLLLFRKDEMNRVYPYSESANTVLDVLRNSINNVNVFTNTNIVNIEYKNNQYILYDENHNKFECKILVLASGGKAYYKSSNSHLLAKILHHNSSKLFPSLVGLKVSEDLSCIQNLRFKVEASLYQDNNLIHQELGEVLFKKDGLSGIVIFNMTSFYHRLENKNNVQIKLDLMPYHSKEELKKIFTGKKDPLFGIMPKMIAQYIKKQNSNLIDSLKALTFNIIDSYDFSNAQVTAGGVYTKQIDKSCRSNIMNDLYIIGEMLDVDGLCGGFNLQFAFSSAGVAYMDILARY